MIVGFLTKFLFDILGAILIVLYMLLLVFLVEKLMAFLAVEKLAGFLASTWKKIFQKMRSFFKSDEEKP